MDNKKESDGLNKFLSWAHSTDYSYVCAYSTTYIGAKILNYDVSLQSVVDQIGVSQSQKGLSLDRLSNGLRKLGISSRTTLFHGNYEFGSNTIGIVYASPVVSNIGHLFLVRPHEGGYQLIDPPSNPVHQETLNSLQNGTVCIYVFPPGSQPWEMLSKAEVLEVSSAVAVAIGVFVLLSKKASQFILRRRKTVDADIIGQC